MPDTPIFDYHEHAYDDHIHRTTGYAHIHDRHPYHTHDRNGSILYLDDLDNSSTVRRIIDVLNPDPIGAGGYDVSYRTP